MNRYFALLTLALSPLFGTMRKDSIEDEGGEASQAAEDVSPKMTAKERWDMIMRLKAQSEHHCKEMRAANKLLQAAMTELIGLDKESHEIFAQAKQNREARAQQRLCEISKSNK